MYQHGQNVRVELCIDMAEILPKLEMIYACTDFV